MIYNEYLQGQLVRIVYTLPEAAEDFADTDIAFVLKRVGHDAEVQQDITTDGTTATMERHDMEPGVYVAEVQVTGVVQDTQQTRFRILPRIA